MDVQVDFVASLSNKRRPQKPIEPEVDVPSIGMPSPLSMDNVVPARQPKKVYEATVHQTFTRQNPVQGLSERYSVAPTKEILKKKK